MTAAREKIRAHLEKLRDDWARKWPYFGQDPKRFDQQALAEDFERALWAAFLEGIFSQGAKACGFTFADLMTKKVDARLKVDHVNPKTGDVNKSAWQHSIYRHMHISTEIVAKLRKLNIVRANTPLELGEQQGRIAKDGAPQPTALVFGEADELDEIRALWDWAHKYPAQATDDVKRKGAEGIPRKLDPIPKY